MNTVCYYDVREAMEQFVKDNPMIFAGESSIPTISDYSLLYNNCQHYVDNVITRYNK